MVWVRAIVTYSELSLMLRRMTVMVAISGFVMLVPVLAQDKPAAKPAEKQAEKPAAVPALPKCPVMGEEIDLSVKMDTPDGPVYFCCKDCIADYTKEPAKFADKVKAQREALAKLPHMQVTCPISGKPVDGKTSADVNGMKVQFCCPACVDKYKADAAKLAGKLACCFTYQMKCPVSGKDISPAAFVDLPTGQRIYFCCKDCIGKFNAKPADYVGKLADQGVHVDAKKLGEKK